MYHAECEARVVTITVADVNKKTFKLSVYIFEVKNKTRFEFTSIKLFGGILMHIFVMVE